MRLAWLTDIHLNFVKDGAIRRLFLESVGDQADAIAISGDIAESHNVVGFLLEMDRIAQKPIYFVLGNHDFYGSSITKTRCAVAEIARHSMNFTYLTARGVGRLTADTAIVGHDGWPDGKSGDYERSSVILSDHLLIEEIARWYDGHWLDKQGLRETMFTLATEAARHFEKTLEEAASSCRHVIAVTHVPPFREASWHKGRVSDEDHLPYFACQTVGDVMRNVMRTQSRSELLVLCGHTHGSGELQVAENLRVLTGAAEYGKPEIARILDVK